MDPGRRGAQLKMGFLLAIALAGAPIQLALAQQEPQQQDDFDLLPKAKGPDPAAQKALERKLSLRRDMLQLHQLGGFLTAASMGLTVAVGQANYADKYGGGGDTGRFRTLHLALGFTTAGLFALTGSLALFAPSPLEKPLRLDTATIHKISMAVATAGMLAQIILGPITASKDGQLSQRDFALAHQIIGYTTFVATAAGAVVLTF